MGGVCRLSQRIPSTERYTVPSMTYKSHAYFHTFVEVSRTLVAGNPPKAGLWDKESLSVIRLSSKLTERLHVATDFIGMLSSVTVEIFGVKPKQVRPVRPHACC